MPLLKTWTEENGRWGIWQVTETLEELYACLSDDVVWQELERLKAPSRKMEYLAVRVLLKTMLGKEVRIGHEPSGKPFLTGGEYHVSISHTKGYVAVGLHESAQPGIDIEAYGERVRSGVVIPLNDGLLSIIGEAPTDKNCLIFDLSTYESCCKSVKRWVKRAGIDKHISWHLARHSFAVNILNNGANIKTVASLLGHSGLKHTEKYTRAVDKLKEEAINSLPELKF